MKNFFIASLLIVGQANMLSGQSRIDSLKQILFDISDVRQRVDVLNDLSSEVYDTDVNEGYKYSSEAFEQAKAIKYSEGQMNALILMGYRFTVSGEFQKSLDLYERAANTDPERTDLLGYSYVMTANIYRSIAKYDSARIFYAKSIDVLEKNPHPIYLAFAFKSLARLLMIQWKNKDAEYYFKKAQKIYDETNNIRGKAEILFFLSDVSKNLTEYNTANDYTIKGCEMANEVKSDYLLFLCYRNQGDYYYRLGDYMKAMEQLFKAMDVLKTKEQPLLLTPVYNQLGEVYAELGQHDVALKYYFDALKINERLGLKYEVAKVYSEIGWIYKNQLNFSQARLYMEKSLALREEIKDEHGISNSYNVLGVLTYQEKKYNEALKFLEKSLQIRERIGHKEGISASIFNMALVYEDLGQYDKALENHFEALAIDEMIGNKQGLSTSYNQIGQVYTKAKNFREAEKYLTKATNLARETGSKIATMNNRLFFSSLYEAQGNLRKALQYHKLYAELNDSIYSDGNAMRLAELQALYQVEQKNQEIELLNQNKEIQNNQIQLQRSQIRQQRTIIISGLVGLALIGVFGFKTYQYTSRIRKASREILEQKEEIQAQSEELIEANQTIAQINKDLESKIEERTSALRQAYKELDTFFYRSSHDFRRPLTTFLGLAEVAKITVKDQNALELFSKVKETASNLDKMLVKLQSISDVGAQQLVYKEVFVKEIVDNVCDGFSDELKQKNIKVSCSVELKESFYSYPAMFKTIIENLIENSIYFSGFEHPIIKVKAFQDTDHVNLAVEDNGQGIDPQYQDRIFDMYFRGSERSKGNGLGLYIVKKAVEKLNGKITVTSVYGRGSVFLISFPTNHNHTDVIH
ncbi:MAG TPA: tetratricopeptide repeat-containing sensor histidine kinase [Chryseolinea sp.]